MGHDTADTADAAAPLRFDTADGVSLEGEVHLPAGARAVVVLAHPHPAQGGTMRSLVTSELFRLLPAAGLGALRFNFRGVEGSGGHHAHGRDEHLDVEAALDEAERQAPELALVVAGWSFGADVALTVDDPRVRGWALLAPPLRVVEAPAMRAAHDRRPKLVVVPERDPFNPPGPAREATADWASTEVEVVAGADHFFAGRTAQVATLVEAFVDSLLA